jgi:gliding motility-associated-like protein
MDVLTATDNCATITVESDEEIMNGDCPGNYLIVRTWTADDGINTPVVLTQMINVVDTVGPTLTSSLDTELTVTCAEIPGVPEPTFEDNCSGVSNVEFTETQTDVVDNLYIITRTWTATDACNNETEVRQTITVNLVAELISQVSAESCNEAEFDTIDLTTLLPTGTPQGGTWINVDNASGLNGTIFNGYQVPGGNYTFSYVYDTNGSCPEKVDVNMTVNTNCGVLPCENIIIHNAFTPNGDSLNQFFSIENIEDFDCYPTNKVEIYNRWGVLVYETTNYDNNTRRFEGISEGRVTISKSSELPTGTYFYIIQYTTTEGNTVNKNGYLYLTR